MNQARRLLPASKLDIGLPFTIHHSPFTR